MPIKNSSVSHLSSKEIIENGSIFTPQFLVSTVFNLLNKYIHKNSIIGDLGSGYGAFLQQFSNLGKRCFATEYDKTSYMILKNQYPYLDIYNENSLLNINRQKYNLKSEDELIIIGNPPYNDITSKYKKGNKGSLMCDEDVMSRDFGISFLKTYHKLNAKYICVLHPLAYLIKKANFKSLGSFKDNYKLIDGYIFSSHCFDSIKKTKTPFPVIAALYEKNQMVWNMNILKISILKFWIQNSWVSKF
ncbi:N-6 DNA methylase family protein [Mycoplasmopsis primatum]|uniref:Eco57I restriction-modification methylase domain-containing protein n=1 Tax=Mycoplasmopsis primatum TaxID=55604 RepID=UPI00068AFEDD|nr:Eco57I restriction-modification methylase domain-containing protein [Mycoplasmopsis primatum]